MDATRKQQARAPKPEAAQTELSEAVLANVVGGFNPQPDPPGVVGKLVLPSQFGIRAFGN
jgi:hypothetical protein